LGKVKSGTLLTKLNNSKRQGNERTRGVEVSHSRKTAGKPARGGQALDLLTIALKTDFSNQDTKKFCRTILVYAEVFLYSNWSQAFDKIETEVRILRNR